MTTEKTPIFLTGATGYIGGSVLARLLDHTNKDAFAVSTIVRSSHKADILRSKFGVDAVIGSFQDLDKIETLAENAHVVLHLADPDDENLMNAILRGLRKRHEWLGVLPILIHTSGTGVITDDARGLYAGDIVYDDVNVEQLKSIPTTAFHRNVDILVFDADSHGYVKSHIIAPSTIYGLARNPLVDAGVANDRSLQIPALVKASIGRGRAGVVGEGKALWPSVHIDDITNLYMTVFNSTISNPAVLAHGWEGFFFGESGEHSWYQISRAIGEAMVALGLSSEAEPTTFSTAELIKYFGSEKEGNYSGTNARCHANRGRHLGWRPTHTTNDMLESIRVEVERSSK